MKTRTKEVDGLIDRLHDEGLYHRVENLDRYFHKRVVMIQPGTYKKLTGYLVNGPVNKQGLSYIF